MPVEMRSFTWKKDFELVREFLIHTYSLFHTFQNWIPSMFENIKFGPCGSKYRDEDDEHIKIWEDTNRSDSYSASEIVAVTYCKPSGGCWIQIHPDYRFFEKKLVHWIEKHKRETGCGGPARLELRFYVDETDEKRKALLKELGYDDSGLSEYNRIRLVDTPVPEYTLPEGFAVRSVDAEQDFHEYKKVLTAVFPHCSFMTEEKARIYSNASFYNKDLDLVAVDSHGNFAAFCTVRMDPISRMAELEPVGTHPDFRKLGLARAVVCEGLHRLQKYRPSSICILGAAPTEAANRLYESTGFTEKTEVHIWRKKL